MPFVYYELLIAWRKKKTKKKTPIIALEDFPRIGISNHEYTIMGDFKKRVFEPSITQINTHTDIIAGYEQHKGRAYYYRFFIHVHPKETG